MSTSSEIHDPYAGQYPPPKPAVTTSKPLNEPFYLVDPYNSTSFSHPSSFQVYNNSRFSHSYSDPRSSQTYNNSRPSRIYSDPRSSQSYSGSRSSQTQNNSRSSSLPLSLSDQSRQSESTIISNSNQFGSHISENMKNDYYDPETVNLREYLEAEREEKSRIRKEIEMELRYSQPPAKLDQVHYTHHTPDLNKTNTAFKNKNKKKGAKNSEDLENEKYAYKKTYSLRSVLGIVLLIFFLLAGVGLVVADRVILSQCDCDGCIECSTAFHQGLLYSGIGLLCISGFILVFKILRRVCC